MFGLSQKIIKVIRKISMKRIIIILLLLFMVTPYSVYGGEAFDVHKTILTRNSTPWNAPPGTEIDSAILYVDKEKGSSYYKSLPAIYGYKDGSWIRYYPVYTEHWFIRDSDQLNGLGSIYSVNFPSGVTSIKIYYTEDQMDYSYKSENIYTEIITKRTTISQSDLAEIESAVNSAKTSADAAHTDAQNAANRTIYNGKSAAQWAAESKSSADNASAVASSAADRVWDSAEGKSAATLAKEARDKANTIDNKLTYLENKLINIENNISATDSTAPTLISIGGLNGATCTTTSSYTLYVNCSDNGPDSNLRYRVECGSFDSGWVSSNTITITGLSQGAKTANVKVSDNPTSPEDGNITQVSYTFFKI